MNSQVEAGQPTLRDVADGILRVTFPLPLGIDHIHCYLLRSGRGWTLVDTGLGLPGMRERWREVLARVEGPLERIVVTHYHPDHIGATGDVVELTGAPVYQGRDDHEQTLRVWGDPAWPAHVADWFRTNGVPADELERSRRRSSPIAQALHIVEQVVPLEAGDRVAGWDVLALPGHADGHIALFRDGVLIAGDTILERITPTVGFYPGGRADPLADFLASLEHLRTLGARIAFAGHGPPIADVEARALELRAHHRERLERTAAALDGEVRSAFEVSLELFGRSLDLDQRRFAVAESLAHLERLTHAGSADRVADGDRVGYVRV